MARQRVVLVDGTAIIFRAFFAIPSSFQTTSGIPTNATYGFALMFRKLFAGKTPAIGAVVFDAPGKTFRDERYPAYKAQRPAVPSDLRKQIPWINRLVEAHDFPILSVQGYEADDVIGTLTRMSLEAGHEVHIISGDKDFAQLIGDDVRMIDTVRDITYDAELVRKKWGVPPSQFVDYLALVGDKIDNIPGVPGVGPKSAKSLLEKYGDLEGVLAASAELKGKQRERLEAHADDARTSKELATIDQHVPEAELDLTLDELRIPPVDAEKVDDLYRELEFYSMLSEDAGEGTDADADHGALKNASEVRDYLQELRDGGVPVAVFAMSGEPSEIHGQWLGVALASTAEPARARYVALGGDGSIDASEALRTFFEDAEIQKVTHDLRDLTTLLLRHDVSMAGVLGDAQLASYVVDPTKDIPHRLDQIARSYLHRPLIQLKTLVGGGKDQRALASIGIEELAAFACQQVQALAEAWDLIAEAMAKEEQVSTHDELLMPMAKVLAGMQVEGIRADAEILQKLGKEFAERKATLETEVYELAGREFNIGSSKQLGAVLFDELGLPVLKRTKTGYSTAADVLERLAPKHDIAAKIIRWRALAKLINTYTRVLREAISEKTGRIHCLFQQTASTSGRIITTEPDLQRTPIRTDDGKRIREAFVPRDGWLMISADWSQIELRILAHVTRDERLLESFQEDVDVHRRTAAEIYDVAPEEVTAEQREVGKTVNFATIYGQGATALGQSLGISRSEAKKAIDAYFEAYAGVRTWLDETVDRAYKDGFVMTLGGRRRYIPELSSNNMTDRSYGERIATNTPIQGSGADICMMAMLAIAKRLETESMHTKMLLQIHDELIFECPPDELNKAKTLVLECMQTAYPLDVPLKVDIGHGGSWAEAH